MKNAISVVTLCFILLVQCVVFVDIYKTQLKSWDSSPLTWDVAGHYMYLPCFHYDNLLKLDNWKNWVKQYNINGGSESFYQAYVNKNTNNYVLKYPIGMSLMYAPAFYISKISDNNSNKTGFTFPYRISIYAWSILFCFLGLVVMRLNLLYYYSDFTVSFSLMFIFFGTNYFMYSNYSSATPHGYLFTIYALIIFFCIEVFEKNKFNYLIIIAILIGLCTIIRPTDILIAILPISWTVKKYFSLQSLFDFFSKERKRLLLSVLFFISVISIQLIYWKISSGKLVTWSYESEEGFRFLKPFFLECFFSYKKGWLVYTPLMLFALLGFISLYFQNKKLFIICFIFSFINIWVLFSWKTWWYGGSFSMRAVIQMYAILLFPLCSLIEFLYNRRFIFTIFSFVVFIGIYLNLIMTYQVNKTNIFDTEHMTKAYYWKILGKTEVPKKYKSLKDNKDFFEDNNVRFYKDFVHFNFDDNETSVSENFFSKPGSLNLTSSSEFSKEFNINNNESYDWINVSFMAYCNQFIGGDISYCNIYLMENNTVVKVNSYNFLNFTDINTWSNISFDIKRPKNKKIDKIKLEYKKSLNPTQIYIDDIYIRTF